MRRGLGRGGLRIIPARAGFTRCRLPSARQRRDHPRSRGVYGAGTCSPRTAIGSSPLARGLPGLRRAPRGGLRIIPARAGFTDPRRSGEGEGWDHPRSRGVYRTNNDPRSPAEGSSPLARGLRPCQSFSGLSARIIPARAGFTSSVTALPEGRWDHPRSRGVYGVAASGVGASLGSSPLARGLRGAVVFPGAVVRIIPARAGFTIHYPHGDHLRTGSSPLARGLRGLVSVLTRTRRIIPARAGFTLPTAPGATGSPDHPRSRGVYCGGRRCHDGDWGSSPLARGLHVHGEQPERVIGIIPARAGFTPHSSTL